MIAEFKDTHPITDDRCIYGNMLNRDRRYLPYARSLAPSWGSSGFDNCKPARKRMHNGFTDIYRGQEKSSKLFSWALLARKRMVCCCNQRLDTRDVIK